MSNKVRGHDSVQSHHEKRRSMQAARCKGIERPLREPLNANNEDSGKADEGESLSDAWKVASNRSGGQLRPHRNQSVSALLTNAPLVQLFLRGNVYNLHELGSYEFAGPT